MQESAVPPMPSVPIGLGSLAIFLQQGHEAALAVKRDKAGEIWFLVVPRGPLGFRQGNAQRFPMDHDGWVKAWACFRTMDAATARDLAVRLTADDLERGTRRRLLELADEDAYLTLSKALLVGGYRAEPLTVGTSYLVQFLTDSARIVDRTSADIALYVGYEDLVALVVDGDGASDRRLTGGQFALAVAAEGLLTAALMSSLASQHGIATYVEIQTVDFHAVFGAPGLAVGQARLALKPVHAQLRMVSRDSQRRGRAAGEDLLNQLERLQILQQQGVLTPSEFDAAKRRILG